MTSVLVAYATKHGSTQEVAEAIGETIRNLGLDVDVRRVHEVADPGLYAGIVLGGALYMGRWHHDARRFLKRHAKVLATLPLAGFGIGPQTMDEASVAGSRAQLDNALREVLDVEPVEVAIFGGAVDPAKLHFPFSHMPASDARDWDAIRVWAKQVGSELDARSPLAIAS